MSDAVSSAPAWAKPVASAAVSMRFPNMMPGNAGSGVNSWAPNSIRRGAREVKDWLKERVSWLNVINSPGFSPGSLDLDAVSYSLSDSLSCTMR